MSLEKLGAIHPSVKKVVKELQGLRQDLVAGAAANVNATVAGINPEDTLLAALNNNAGTITAIANNTITIADAFARATVTLVNGANGNTVTIRGLLYTAVTGVKANNTQFSIDGSDTVDAADLADSINSRDSANVTATSALGVVSLTAVAQGTVGNAITLAKVGAPITISGATFVNGTGVKANGTLTLVGALAGVTVTVNGKVYTAVSAANANSNDSTTFSIGGTDTQDAADLARAINLRESRPDGGGTVTAVNAAGVVTITATAFGTEPNSFTLVGDTGITANNATLVNGAIIGGAVRAASTFNQMILLWFNKR